MVSDLETRVRWEVTPEVEAATTPQSVPARIVIKLKSEIEHTTFVPAPKGSPSRPFTHADHLARFRRELSTRWPDRTCDELIAAADDLSAVDRMSRIADLLI
jgi:2-methylcitrate dehydratase PrpD